LHVPSRDHLQVASFLIHRHSRNILLDQTTLEKIFHWLNVLYIYRLLIFLIFRSLIIDSCGVTSHDVWPPEQGSSQVFCVRSGFRSRWGVIYLEFLSLGKINEFYGKNSQERGETSLCIPNNFFSKATKIEI